RPRLRERLALPKLAVSLGEIAGELLKRRRQRAATARRPQPQINLIQLAVRPEVAHGLDDSLPQLAEKMLVVRRRSAAGAFERGGTVGFVDEHQIEVALVIQLAAAELAERQDDKPARLAGARPFADRRLAELDHELFVLAGGDAFEADLRNVGQRAGRG